jgi:hypothetical protein
MSSFAPKNTDMPLRIMYGDSFMTPEPGRKFQPVYEASGFARLYDR